MLAMERRKKLIEVALPLAAINKMKRPDGISGWMRAISRVSSRKAERFWLYLGRS